MPAALHALVVGVSDYPYLPGGLSPRGRGYGMQQLTATASSAAAVLRHLEQLAGRLALPIGSQRLLLSPSPQELERGPSLMADAQPATRENVRNAALEWREDCASDGENIAFFYFGGHGVQRTRKDWALLLLDFNDRPGNPLYNAVDVNNLFSGMAPTVTHPQMARTQLWFVDACRGFPAEFDAFETLEATRIFDVGLSDLDDRCAPVYCGALPGASAYAIAGEQTVFGRALIECLGDTGAEQPLNSSRWVVSVSSLLRAMQTVVEEINAREGSDQEIWDGGQTPRPDTVIVKLDGVPNVPVRLELVPAAAAADVVLRFHRSDGTPVPVPAPLDPNPFADTWRAGIYRYEAHPPVECQHDGELLVRPPRFPWQGVIP
jgi:hypothetical protein